MHLSPDEQVACGRPSRDIDPSEGADVTPGRLHHGVQVDAVSPSPGRRKGGEPVRGSFEEPGGPDLVSSGRVRHRDADLRQPLPQVTRLFIRLDIFSAPTKFQSGYDS
jgi:hypothetical protein